MLALVTGIAHYLKILIWITLTGALKLEKEQSMWEAMASCLDKLHLLAVQRGDPGACQLIKNGSGEIMGQNGCTHRVTYGYRSLASELVGESPFSITSPSWLSVNNPPCQMHVGSGGGLCQAGLSLRPPHPNSPLAPDARTQLEFGNADAHSPPTLSKSLSTKMASMSSYCHVTDESSLFTTSLRYGLYLKQSLD